ncbi:MAG: hypothetical protein SangKO_064460 [Sandaracinaceae bacterium]
MPRTRRLECVDSLVHIIVRTVDEKFIFTDDEVRAAYLTRLNRAVARTDWRLAAYAVMSNHVHLVMLTGLDPLVVWAKRAHCGFVVWYHRRRRAAGERSRGPIIAERPTCIHVDAALGGLLVGYVHDNPVRAGVVSRPEDSSWTSHRAVLGLEPGIPQLDIELARDLCALSSRAAVAAPRFDAERIPAVRTRVREAYGTGVEVSSATLAARLTMKPALSPGAHAREGFLGTAEEVLRAVAKVEEVGVAQMRERLRRDGRTRARRVAILTWFALERPMTEMAAALAVSRSAASRVVTQYGGDSELLAAAGRVLRVLNQARQEREAA